jgi:HSP20 family protein
MSLIRRTYLNPRSYSNWNLWSDFDELFSAPNHSPSPQLPTTFSPHSEVKENDKGYLLSLDIPGMKEDDIKIEFNNSILKVFGERKSEVTQEQDGYFQTEKSYGRFDRQFRVPESVNDAEVEANYKDGVLQIFLPKTAAKVSKQIEIKKNEPSLLKKLFTKNEEQH